MIHFQTLLMSPSSTTTALQIVCFFDKTKNQHYAGGTEAVDEYFQGAIKTLRAEDHFRGERFETLLITPQHSEIPAKRLLLIGLGDPATLSSAVLTTIGHIAVNEALKLGVSDFCFAPSLKDAGVECLHASEVSFSLVNGMKKAIASAKTLSERGLNPKPLLKEISLLAGEQSLESAQAGMRKSLET